MRDNFFTLLGLNPNETDVTIIEEKITEKQREWSKLRNHPSKGREAQSYLGMLKEIKEVMNNPELREKEKQDALKAETQLKKDVFDKLDKMIAMLSAKGELLQKEYDGIINAFPEVDEKIIKSKIKVPIKIEKHTEYIAETIIQKIEELLKIIKKNDLYDFLEIPQNVNLTVLQKNIEEKYIQNNKNSAKTAQVTAASELLGFCGTIFKSIEEKVKYDNTILLLRMKNLNQFIDIAGIDGIIQQGEFAHILNEAKELNINIEKAKEYIIDYSRKKGWSVEIASTQTVNVIQQKTESKQNSNELLLKAAKEGNLNDVENLIQSANVNYKNESGNTALILASYFGHTNIVKKLVQNGANLNAFDNNGVTSLIWCASENRYDIAKILIESGINVNHQDNKGYSALMWACLKGNSEIVKLLLNNNANKTLLNNNGETAMFIAQKNGKNSIVQIFANVSPSDNNAELLEAVKKGDLEKINQFLLRGANINYQDSEGKTPLIHSILSGYKEITQSILLKGANINTKDKNGNSPAIHAILKKDIIVLTELEKKRCDLNAEDKEGYTPLMHAVNINDEICIKFLLTKKIDLNKKDNYGNTALTLAVWQGKYNIVRILIDAKSDVNVINNKGKNLMDLAFERNNRDIISHLSLYIKPTPQKVEKIEEKPIEKIIKTEQSFITDEIPQVKQEIKQETKQEIKQEETFLQTSNSQSNLNNSNISKEIKQPQNKTEELPKEEPKKKKPWYMFWKFWG